MRSTLVDSELDRSLWPVHRSVGDWIDYWSSDVMDEPKAFERLSTVSVFDCLAVSHHLCSTGTASTNHF